ncbi:hypothetical protein SAMN04487905_1095 [Actinopolyspora xinjiangensis]|uniref:Uncharacterized protein n=2 Tax=Actinopolyspora xinjiangensis TaxID=405564 RepID=A0A1H0VIP4_9ACTN|nr:hypothetical protein SAMN04487905_1095 [Actinopolyspora xinjiangensis]
MTAILEPIPQAWDVSVRVSPREGGRNSFWLEVSAPVSGPVVFYSIPEAAIALNYSGTRLHRHMTALEIAAAVADGVEQVGIDHIRMAIDHVSSISLREVRGQARTCDQQARIRVWTERREDLCTDLAFRLVRATERGL